MNEYYKAILDAMVNNNNIIDEMDGHAFLQYLFMKGTISDQEEHNMKNMNRKSSARHLISFVLKSKLDIDMMHFHDSLNDAKSKAAHDWLEKELAICHEEHPETKPKGLGNLEMGSYVGHPSVRSKSIFVSGDHECIRDKLKRRYSEDLDFIENYWTSLGDTRGNITMKKFYNPDIIITDTNQKLESKISNFGQMFQSKYRRFCIFAEAGYGKSTFVHQMVREWVNGESWTEDENFSLVFLFRLGEVSKIESESLQSLLRKYLSENDARLAIEPETMENCLFIFDGLDELQFPFHLEIKNLLFGKGPFYPRVVVTSRPGEHLTEFLNGSSRHLNIKLEGFTEQGMMKQIQKFTDHIIDDDGLKKFLKIPIYNTIFCLTHSDTCVGSVNICEMIKKFVQFLCDRHRKSDPSFNKDKENELISVLGQAAIVRLKFVKPESNMPHPFEYPTVNNDLLKTAVEVGLIHGTSRISNIIFPHRTIAEYCAAKFYIENRDINKDNLTNEGSRTLYKNAEFFINEGMFPRFLSNISNNYKRIIWKNFKEYFPLFDEYESLDVIPPHGIEENFWKLRFNLSLSDQIHHYILLHKIDLSTCHKIQLTSFILTADIMFDCLKSIQVLHLRCCSFKISPEFDEQYITRKNNYTLGLETLIIDYLDPSMHTFLNYIMSHGTNLTSFAINRINFHPYFSEYNGPEDIIPRHPNKNSWISNLKKHSIKDLSLDFSNWSYIANYSYDLLGIFESLNGIINLTSLKIKFNSTDYKHRAIYTKDILALSAALKNGWKHLESLVLRVNLPANLNSNDRLLVITMIENIAEIRTLKILKLFINCCLDKDLISTYDKLLKNLKLDECLFYVREANLHKEELISMIRSCNTCNKFTIFTNEIDNREESELFKIYMSSKGFELEMKEFNEVDPYSNQYLSIRKQNFMQVQNENL